MPERLKYAHLFKGNPFEGKNPEEAFSLLHWGNRTSRVFEVDAPEPLVMMGMMALLRMEQGHELRFGKGEAFLAVGNKTNTLYIVPRVNNAPKKRVPSLNRSRMRYAGKVKATHYLAQKGGTQEHYYYHDHEQPYPGLYLDSSGVGYIVPATWKGGPSYAVGKEGIVG